MVWKRRRVWKKRRRFYFSTSLFFISEIWSLLERVDSVGLIGNYIISLTISLNVLGKSQIKRTEFLECVESRSRNIFCIFQFLKDPRSETNKVIVTIIKG